MARKTKAKRHRQPKLTNPYVLIPRRMKNGEKHALADFIKTLPVTTDPAVMKKFTGRQGAHRFLQRHPNLKKRLRYAPLAEIAA